MAKCKKVAEFIYRFALRQRNRNKNFTIISNNCWGGGIYEDLGLQYTTPTVGLFFYAPCYIKFLKNLKLFLSYPLEFKNTSYYTNGVTNYPIGILNNEVEIHFLHYKTEKEALEKWTRRKERINFQNLFISFSDRDFCTTELIQEFDLLKFKNKVFFSSKNLKEIKSLVYLKKYKDHDAIGDIYNNKWGYRKTFSVSNWLNNVKKK